MESVITALLASELAARHQLNAIVTYREGTPAKRILAFGDGLVRLAVWCRGSGDRIVHIHATVRGSLVRKAVCVVVAKALGRPVLLQVHAGALEVEKEHGAGGVRTRLLAAGFRRADETVSVSAATAGALERCFGLRDVGVVPNPAPVPVRGRPASEGPSGRSVRVLYLGGFLNPVKGGDVLLEALPEVLAASVVVLLAGPGEPPALPFEHGAPVSWGGWLEAEAKEQAIREADILVLPSISEGLPMALLDGLSNGLAVVATRVGGIPEVVDDEVEALLVEPGDPQALARAVTRLAGDEGLRGRLGDAGRSRARRLTAEEVVSVLDQRYRRLAGTHAKRGSEPAPRSLYNRSAHVVFLAYHSIADDGPEFLSLAPETFERQLALLRRRGYRSGGHAELGSLVRGEVPRVPTVFLTFDDGYRDTYDVARPLLEAYGFRAIVFALPTLMDSGDALAWHQVHEAARRWPQIMRSMTWEMAEEMAAAGHEFGAHTLTHPRLTEIDDEQLVAELAGSRSRIVERLGSCESVAYPFGQCDPRVARAAERAGFTAGFSLPFGAQRSATRFTIPRVNVDERDTPLRFGLKISGPGRRLLLSPLKPALRQMLGRGGHPGTRYAPPPST
jgi:glycosyltransferase involved in cell wall biosynthesis/peptidoglycan/xylan/chitin deacetylase (PgdA/CDA1 family)